MIELDAVVIDRSGRPVEGLTPDDFEVLENGVPREITNLTEYRDGEDVSLTSLSVDERETLRQPRTITLLIDAMRTSSSDRRRLFQNLRELVEKTMREGDRGQVLVWEDWKGLGELTPMTRSKAEMLEAVEIAERTLVAQGSDRSLGAEADWFREMAAAPDRDGEVFDGETNVRWSVEQEANRELAVMRRKTAAIQRVLPAIADPSARNVLVYVSGSFPMVAGRAAFAEHRARIAPSEQEELSSASMLESLSRTANAHGVVIYAMRPDVSASAMRLSSSASRPGDQLDASELGVNDGGDRTFGNFAQEAGQLADSHRDTLLLQNDVQALSLLATSTGGTVAIGSSGISDAIDDIARDLGSYYTLAYPSVSDGTDRERRIELRPRNREHIARVRRTILDRSASTRARDLLIARLFEEGSSGAVPFSIETGTPREESRRRIVPVELIIPADSLEFAQEEDELAARFTVILVAGASIGEVSQVTESSRRVVAASGRRPQGVIRFDFELAISPEPVHVSVAVFDEVSGLAGVQSMRIEEGRIAGDAVTDAGAADVPWREALESARESGNLVLAYFRPVRCEPCERFEERTLGHPAIERRLDRVTFVRLHPTAGTAGKLWATSEPGLGVFDRLGNLLLHVSSLPDPNIFGTVLNDIADTAPFFESAARAIESGSPARGALDSAIAYMILGHDEDARTALDEALEGDEETRQVARIARALLDADLKRPAAGAEKRRAAVEVLDHVIRTAATPHTAGEAFLARGLILRTGGEEAAADDAFATASGLLEDRSRIAATSHYAMLALERAPDGKGQVQIVPPEAQVVSGSVRVRTRVGSAAVERVDFTLDGEKVAGITTAPFTAMIELGEVPERHIVAAVAYDARGTELGRDEIILNPGGERFWVRILDPRGGIAGGRVRVRMQLRAPEGEAVERITVWWNDETRAVVANRPWETTVRIPETEIGVLRAVAELSDGRRVEDAVLLNAPGHVEHADVPVVELPVTIQQQEGSEPLDLSDLIWVTEGARTRSVASVQTPEESALTIGMVIDTSGSMEPRLLDVQQAAIDFLDTALAAGDRAFVVGFSTRADLVQPPTEDPVRLRDAIDRLRARGSTSLYDAIAVGLMQMEGVRGRRALVVFTDGMDSTSRYGASAVAELARRSHVPIHLIAAAPARSIVRGPAGGARNWAMEFDALVRMAESTGGSGHRLGALGNLPRIYASIGDALRSQYLVVVRTDPGESASEWREIRVGVRSGGPTIYAPAGYYAPW